ncbi:hypothetical protein E6C55_19720 [Cohnella fermenti]|uniref:Uncharacterized protein n=1 Tax=Cohnella fermenti TaxID=2565925 RepID=A0A4S4BNJ6_9BACL|nr:hypothetical protein E6C55_19720 [Cohnella fermenti]
MARWRDGEMARWRDGENNGTAASAFYVIFHIRDALERGFLVVLCGFSHISFTHRGRSRYKCDFSHKTVASGLTTRFICEKSHSFGPRLRNKLFPPCRLGRNVANYE